MSPSERAQSSTADKGSLVTIKTYMILKNCHRNIDFVEQGCLSHLVGKSIFFSMRYCCIAPVKLKICISSVTKEGNIHAYVGHFSELPNAG